MAKNYIINPGEAIAEAIAALRVSTDELCKEFNEVLTATEKKLDGYLGYCQGKQVYATTMAEYLERKWVYCGTFVVITDERFRVKGARPVVKGTTGTICAWCTKEGDIMPYDNISLLLLAQNLSQQSIYFAQSQQSIINNNLLEQIRNVNDNLLEQVRNAGTKQKNEIQFSTSQLVLKKEEEVLSKEDMKYWLYF